MLSFWNNISKLHRNKPKFLVPKGKLRQTTFNFLNFFEHLFICCVSVRGNIRGNMSWEQEQSSAKSHRCAICPPNGRRYSSCSNCLYISGGAPDAALREWSEEGETDIWVLWLLEGKEVFSSCCWDAVLLDFTSLKIFLGYKELYLTTIYKTRYCCRHYKIFTSFLRFLTDPSSKSLYTG